MNFYVLTLSLSQEDDTISNGYKIHTAILHILVATSSWKPNEKQGVARNQQEVSYFNRNLTQLKSSLLSRLQRFSDTRLARTVPESAKGDNPGFRLLGL
ncbi:hypothetical protein J6590_002225 [Homalodisca vitripennis]|nr:hypothetical protein J6590_002225 [Homalodisca vitripennis]